MSFQFIMDFQNAVNFMFTAAFWNSLDSTNKLGMLGEWSKVTAFLVILDLPSGNIMNSHK